MIPKGPAFENNVQDEDYKTNLFFKFAIEMCIFPIDF